MLAGRNQRQAADDRMSRHNLAYDAAGRAARHLPRPLRGSRGTGDSDAARNAEK
jgi:hypothetical protein